MRPCRFIPVLALALSLAQAGWAAPAPVTVKISNFTFTAPLVTVPAGTTVTWVNEDDIPHTVVAEDKKTFRSKVLDTDGVFAFTFTAPGTYAYFCSIHPHMTGKIVVMAPSAGTAAAHDRANRPAASATSHLRHQTRRRGEATHSDPAEPAKG